MRAATNCNKQGQLGQLEISVECDEANLPAGSLKWLLEWIESEVAAGRRFLPEETLQVGWSWLQIRQRTDGTLGLFEPDFQSMPIRFVDSVSNSLLHLFLHKSVAESLGLEQELAIPSLRDSAIVCTDFGSHNGFVMIRIKTKAGDSGWLFGCDSRVHDHQRAESLRRISVYEAAICHDRRIIPFLALPADTFVGFGGAVPYFSRGEKDLAIRPGSYLHKEYVERSV